MACQARSNPAGVEATHGFPSTRRHWDHAVEHPSSIRRSMVVSHRLGSRFEPSPSGSGFVRAPRFVFFLSLWGVFSWNFVGVLEAPGPSSVRVWSSQVDV